MNARRAGCFVARVRSLFFVFFCFYLLLPLPALEKWQYQRPLYSSFAYRIVSNLDIPGSREIYRVFTRARARAASTRKVFREDAPSRFSRICQSLEVALDTQYSVCALASQIRARALNGRIFRKISLRFFVTDRLIESHRCHGDLSRIGYFG